jgi:hypothetical protein
MVTSFAELTTENLVAAVTDQIRTAKTQEMLARLRRIEAEKQLIELVGFDKAEGSSSFESCGMRVTLTGKLTRTLDPKKWEEIKHTIPDRLHPIEYKPTLILQAIRYLENNEPETFKQVSAAITTRPAKVAVILKDIEY